MLAIIHTFLANKLTAKAHLIHEEHDEKMKNEGASQEEIKHDIPFKAELYHFLGEVAVGWTDILISFTYKLAISGGRGNMFGLASTVTIVVFGIDDDLDEH